MSTLLGFNWMAYHLDESDWHIMSRIQPASLKLFNDHWCDPFFVERIFATLPDCLITFRDHPLSEEKQDMQRDPAGTGIRHAQSWIDLHNNFLAPIKGYDPARAIFLGINEPGVGTHQERARVGLYTVAFLDTLAGAGLRGGALNLSVGWPDNTGPDTPVHWQPFEPVREAIERGNHVLFVHEYWGPNGPQENFGWLAGRIGQCPWDVPIIIGECGIDHGVVDGNLIGWTHYVDKESYMSQLAWYDREMRRDPRIQGLQCFSYDFAHPWSSFDVRPLVMELIFYAEQERHVEVPPRAVPYYPVNINLPPPEEEPMPDLTTPLGDQVAARLRAALGDRFHDERTSVRRHRNWDEGNYYRNVDSRRMAYLALHHTTGSRSVTVEALTRHHVDTNGWPAIGYHFVVRLGHLHYVGDVNTQRAHVANRNDEALGIAVTGDYRTEEIYVEDLATTRSLIRVLDEVYGHQKDIQGHRQITPPGHTTCPARLMEAIPALRDIPLRFDKVAWAIEQSARILQKEGWHAEHDHLLDSEVYQDAVARR